MPKDNQTELSDPPGIVPLKHNSPDISITQKPRADVDYTQLVKFFFLLSLPFHQFTGHVLLYVPVPSEVASVLLAHPKWKDTMLTEMEALERKRSRSSSITGKKHTVNCKRVLKLKYNPDGMVSNKGIH